MIAFDFYDLPLTKEDQKKVGIKGVIAERYKWKSLIRDRVTLNKLRPESPIENAEVILTRESLHRLSMESLKYTFMPIVDGLIQYGIIKPNARIRYEWIGGKWKTKRTYIEVRA